MQKSEGKICTISDTQIYKILKGRNILSFKLIEENPSPFLKYDLLHNIVFCFKHIVRVD